MRGLFLVLIMALMLAPVCLQAEELIVPENMDMGYSFTAGAMWPINSNLPNSTARPLLGLAWFGPAGDTFGDNSCIGVSAEWMTYERFDGTTVNLMPAMFNLKMYGAASGWRLFTTIGIGILASTDSIPELGIEDGANFGWTVKLGVDITNQFFLQGNFIASNDPGNDGFAGVQLGYRF